MRAPKAFLEKCGKEWFDDYVYLARQPLEDRGFEIVPFDGTFLDDFIERTVFGPDNVLVGSVEATIAFWNALGFKVPKYIGYPVEFDNVICRSIQKGLYRDLVNYEAIPCFIKPADDVKLFTGFVIDNVVTLNNLFMTCPELKPDTNIYVSEILDFKSEYRCFVHKGELVGIKHYAGDYTVFPDMSWINEMLAIEWSDRTVSYTLDVGVGIGGTYLIEINDFWAIGGYGLDGKTYVRMLVDRFQEIKYLNILDETTRDKMKAGMKLHNGNCECAKCDPAMFPSTCPNCKQLTFKYRSGYTMCTNLKCLHLEEDDSIL